MMLITLKKNETEATLSMQRCGAVFYPEKIPRLPDTKPFPPENHRRIPRISH